MRVADIRSGQAVTHVGPTRMHSNMDKGKAEGP